MAKEGLLEAGSRVWEKIILPNEAPGRVAALAVVDAFAVCMGIDAIATLLKREPENVILDTLLCVGFVVYSAHTRYKLLNKERQLGN